MKKVLFTCILDDYDTIADPLVVSEGWDYVCFTDNPDFKSSVWETRLVDRKYGDAKRDVCNIKINCFDVLPEYDYSFWCDGNMVNSQDLNVFFEAQHRPYDTLTTILHPERSCTYQEAEAVLKWGFDSQEVVERVVDRYREVKFPEDKGMATTSLMIRKNSININEFNKAWWNNYKRGSRRCQLSFNFTLWQLGNFPINHIKWGEIKEGFELRPHKFFRPKLNG